MPVLPLSKNIGPGNAPNPSTENWVDGVAYAHDLAYGSAKSQSDIRAADSEFINQVLRVPDSNPLVAGHQLLSVLGIGLKKGIENVFGQVYPQGLPEESMADSTTNLEKPPTQKTASKTPEAAETPAKKQKTASKTKMAGNSGVAPDGSDKVMALPCSNMTNIGNFKRCYTYDLELVTYNPNVFAPNATEGIRPWWVAPCYVFCVEQLGWYLNRGDINYLSRVEGDIKVKHCAGTITIGTITSPFATATATSTQTSANTHTNITMYSGKGLEYHYQMYSALGKLSYDTTAGGFTLAGIDAGNYPIEKLHKWEWPVTPGGVGDLVMPATQVMRSFNNLVCFPYSTTIVNQANINNVPNYKEKMTKVIETTAGSTLNSWSYQPNSYLRLQNTIGPALNATVQVPCQFGAATQLQDGTSALINADTLGEATSNGVIDGLSTIAFNNFRQLDNGNPQIVKQLLPREYVGFLPPTTITGGTIQPIKIHVQVQTEIELEHSVNTDYFINAESNVIAQSQQFRFPTAAMGTMKRFITGGPALYPFHGYEGMEII
jgi:hypothetical protein